MKLVSMLDRVDASLDQQSKKKKLSSSKAVNVRIDGKAMQCRNCGHDAFKLNEAVITSMLLYKSHFRQIDIICTACGFCHSFIDKDKLEILDV